jgi:hypothetical protein
MSPHPFNAVQRELVNRARIMQLIAKLPGMYVHSIEYATACAYARTSTDRPLGHGEEAGIAPQVARYAFKRARAACAHDGMAWTLITSRPQVGA